MNNPAYKQWMKVAIYRSAAIAMAVDVLVQVVSSLLFSILLSSFVPLQSSLLWSLAVSTVAISYLLVVRLRLARPSHTWHLPRWFREYLLYRVVMALLWTWPLYQVWLYPESALLFTTVSIIYALMVLAVSVTNIINGTLAASCLPLLVAALVFAFLSNSLKLLLLAAGITVFALVMIRVSLVIRQVVKYYARLGYERRESSNELRQKNLKERKLLKRISRDRARLQLLAENSTDVIALHDQNGRYLYLNEVLTEIVGYKPAELLNRSPLEFLHKDDRGRLLKAMRAERLPNGKRNLGEFRFRHKAGHYVWLEGYERTLPATEGQASAQTVTVAREVTERHNATVTIASQQQTLATSLGSIQDAVFTLDNDSRVLYANTAALGLLSDSEVIGQFFGEALSFKDERGKTPLAWGQLQQAHKRIVTLSGYQQSYFELSVHPLQPPTSVPGVPDAIALEVLAQQALKEGYVVVLRDISKHRALEQQLRQRAYTDALTSVMNRPAFEERLMALHKRIQRSGGHHALVYVDLDQFKIVNDTAGHHAGDALLKTIAGTLLKAVREGDIVARLGGDEFALLLADCAGSDARSRCQQVCDAVAAIRFQWQDRHYPVSASFGVALFNKSTESVEKLMGQADAACYVVKDQGRKGVHVWDAEDADSDRQLNDMNWISRLQSALDEQRILIYGQQIWALEDNTGKHLEVLISLRDIDGRLVPPNEFIPAAERYGLMPVIDHYVMRAVFQHIAPLQKELLDGGYRIAINLSGHTIGSDSALSQIRKLLHRYAIDASLVCFEITETAALQNIVDAQRFLLALKELGCQLALDDFGTGFSSFSYLKSLPVDMLKIDGEFVREMLHQETDYAIVEGIHKVGHTMGLSTVAECVENADILRELKAMGVTYGQGMFLSPRRPLKDIISQQSLALDAQPLLNA